MELKDARTLAKTLLSEVIAHQPNMIAGAHGHTRIDGESVAKFCSEFTETYSAYLVSREKSER